MTVDETEALVVGWERAFREADSHEKFKWLMAQANEHGGALWTCPLDVREPAWDRKMRKRVRHRLGGSGSASKRPTGAASMRPTPSDEAEHSAALYWLGVDLRHQPAPEPDDDEDEDEDEEDDDA